MKVTGTGALVASARCRRICLTVHATGVPADLTREETKAIDADHLRRMRDADQQAA
jgi:hypothetical protein